MKYRTTIVYLVALLLLAGVYYWDVRREKQEQAQEEEAKTLFQLESEDIERITLERGEETIAITRIAEDKSDNTWTITAPVATAADDYSVNRISSLLPSLKYTRIMEEDAGNLDAFGLDPPALTLAWETEDRRGSLWVGEESPIEKDFYAKKGDENRIFLITAAYKETLDMDLYDLRDKRLFTLTSDEVTRFRYQRPSGSWTFTKSGATTWALEGDAEFPLDSERINAAVRHLTWAEAASFEQEHVNSPEPYGLDSPSHRIELFDGKTSEELLVGKAVESGDEARRYARMDSRPQVLTVPETLLQDLPASSEEIRRKDEDGELSTGE